MRIMVLGDTHGNARFVEAAIFLAESMQCDIIYIVGDFGIWDHTEAGVKFLDFVNESAKLHGITIYFCDGNHECITERSRAVTQRGFVSVEDLKQDDLVLSVDKDGNRIFVPIDEVIRKDYRGTIYQFRSRGIDFDATPGHRIVGTKYGSGNEFDEIAEKVAAGKHFKAVVAAKNVNHDAPISDDELRLIAWCLTDSNPRPSGGWHFYQRESQSHRIRGLLERLDIPYTESSRDRKITDIAGKPVTSHEAEITIRVGAAAGKERIPYDHNHLPTDAIDWSHRQVGIFLEEYIHCDGSFASSGTASVLYCSRGNLRDELHHLLVSNGYRISQTEYRPGHWRLNVSNRTSLDFDTRLDKSVSVETIDYEGEVWCLRVPTGKFFIETDGKTILTGNCFDRLLDPDIYPIGDDGFRVIRDRIIHTPRGHIWQWDDVKFMAMGGAHSIDGPNGADWWQQARGPIVRGGVEGDLGSWWPQETITEEDVKAAEENVEALGTVDVVLSHDLPWGVDLPEGWKDYPAGTANRKMLRRAVDIAKPELVVHGHMHTHWKHSVDFGYGELQVVGLAHDTGVGQYMYIETEPFNFIVPDFSNQ